VVSPGQNEEQNGHSEVRSGDIDPDVDGERLQESEERGLFFDRLAEEDADACEQSTRTLQMKHSTNSYILCKLPRIGCHLGRIYGTNMDQRRP
jgi:hypothetical protein